MNQPTLFDLVPAPAREPELPLPADQIARDRAADPRNHVVLEASAGTGKTRVLVDRYVRLIVEAGVDPKNILAITFTRKAAAEMRDRVLDTLRAAAETGRLAPDAWLALRARLPDIQVSTIDAFCFALLREFPLEADVNPDFEVADETETARFVTEALDLTMRAARALLVDDERLRLLFARVKQPTLRRVLGELLDRRQIAVPALSRFVDFRTHVDTAADAAAAFIGRARQIFDSPHRAALIDDGPRGVPEYQFVREDLLRLTAAPSHDAASVQQLRRRIEAYFFTLAGAPRKRLIQDATDFASPAAKRRHVEAVSALAPAFHSALSDLDADVNGLLAKGLRRVLAIAVQKYEALLEEHAMLDFTGMLDRAVTLLGRQEEFARSRLKLQSRFHHLLIDEFQDTSRRQWQLVDLLIHAWAEGEGTAEGRTSIFVVADRKQSIYRFRNAEVTLLEAAAERIGALRPDRPVRLAINTSFRAVPELLAFVNALSGAMHGDPELEDRWRYEAHDEFPAPSVAAGAKRDGAPVLGLIAEESMEQSAAAVAEEVARLLDSGVVRDRIGAPRPVQPDDIAVLFRARPGYQLFEDAIEARGIRTYVYKGLGFFDAPEVQDLQAIVRYLAQPDSHLRAAAFLRSRVIRVSDETLSRLGDIAGSLLSPAFDAAALALLPLDAALLDRAREAVRRWLPMADRIPPSELVDVILRDSAYLHELGGRRLDQARENVKKLRALIRRVENRGYATLGRLAAYFDTLRAGDDSNAVVEAAGAVNLMTIHAAKGLEFPVVFLVNVQTPGRGGTSNVSVIEHGPSGEPDVSFGSSPATKLELRRETEELRRLMYVAVTRARDRLYFAADLKEGKLRRAGRSLASLMPESLVNLFGQATVSDQGAEVDWVSDRGSFTFRVCRAPNGPLNRPALAPQPTAVDVPAVEELAMRGLHVAAVTDAIEPLVDSVLVPAARRPELTPFDERLLGTVVHRLLQRRIDPSLADDTLEEIVMSMLSSEERLDVPDRGGLAQAAIRLFRGLREQPELSALLGSGTCLYEVPFSYIPPDSTESCLRGVVDCLVVDGTGAATVVEFKTGQPRPEHQGQAELYARAIGAILGFSGVKSRVFYA